MVGGREGGFTVRRAGVEIVVGDTATPRPYRQQCRLAGQDVEVSDGPVAEVDAPRHNSPFLG